MENPEAKGPVGVAIAQAVVMGTSVLSFPFSVSYISDKISSSWMGEGRGMEALRQPFSLVVVTVYCCNPWHSMILNPVYLDSIVRRGFLAAFAVPLSPSLRSLLVLLARWSLGLW